MRSQVFLADGHERLEVNANLVGIIYLHEIVADRYSGSRKRNFDVFKHLCGHSSSESVVLGTTKWGKVLPDEIGKMEQRQKELGEVYWKDMTVQGSRVQRVDDTADSAWQLVETVLNRRKTSTVPLRIQAELVLLAMSIPQTDAGTILRQEMKKRIDSLKRSGATKEEVRAFVDEVAKLKPSFATRLRKWLFFNLS